MRHWLGVVLGLFGHQFGVDDGRVRVETIIPGGDSHLRNVRGDDVCAITPLRFVLEKPLVR